MDIHVGVIQQKLKIPTNQRKVANGSHSFVRFVFYTDDNWRHLTKHAVFAQNEASYDIVLDENNSVYMPDGITNGVFTIALLGLGDNITATTNHINMLCI